MGICWVKTPPFVWEMYAIEVAGPGHRLDLGQEEQRLGIRLPLRRVTHSFRAHVTPYSAIRSPCPVMPPRSAIYSQALSSDNGDWYPVVDPAGIKIDPAEN